jgi:MFS family permease
MARYDWDVRFRLQRWSRELLAYPRQFWLLVLCIFIYTATASLAFPYEAIYLNRELGIRMTVVGVVFGLVPAGVIPLQVWGGQLTDRFGRRRMLILALVMGVVWFAGFAFVREVWQVALLVAVESAFGWPLFQTASNAMIADLLRPLQRQEAFSVTRVAMNLGVVLGPAAAGIALGAGASFRALFLAAAGGCASMVVLAVAAVHETRPAVLESERNAAVGGRHGYRIVLADRRFLLFCAVAALPVFVMGTFISIYSVYITGELGIPEGTWGWLLALNALVVAVVQYPLVRATKRKNRMLLLAASSALLGIGIGGSAFATGLGSLVFLVVVMSLGETLLAPIAAAEVADFAPEVVRGRYMGAWTVVWNGGAALGPAFMGWAMDTVGGRDAFAVLLVVGLMGALLFVLRAADWRRHRRSAPSEA